MGRITRVHTIFLFAAVVVVLSVSSVAQYGAGIEGTVTDKSGATVPGATVTATNEATNVSRNATTQDAGFFRVSGLPPGSYTVSVEAASFRSSSTKSVTVNAEAIRGFNVILIPAQAEQNITVTENTADMQTETPNATGTITAQEVVGLPQFGRDPYQLLKLTPGVFADSSRQGNGNSLGIPQQVGPGGSNSQIFQTENQVQAIANGQRVSANNFLLDGVSVNSLSHGGAAVVTPNQESVQEVVVASDSYSAQDGRNSGAQVKVISKSGTNRFHGSAVFQYNSAGLNAFNKFYGPTQTTPTPITCETGTSSQFIINASHCPDRVDQNFKQFAGSVGGPIIKNKLFFFASYEGVRLKSTSLARDVKLETPQFDQYVIRVNPNSIAAKLFATPGYAPRIATTTNQTDCCSLITNPSDPNYHPLGMWYVPGTGIGQAIGNGPDGIPDWGTYDLTIPSSSDGNQYNARLDYTQGNNQFFLSTYIVSYKGVGGGNRPLEDVTITPQNYVGTIGWTRTIGASMLNEFRVNYTRFAFNQLQPTGTTNYGIPTIELFDFDAGGLGNMNNIGIAQSSTTPGNLAQNTYGLAETFSWAKGRHAMKFGVEIAKEQNYNDQPGGDRPVYQFRGLLNLANDACCFFEQVSVDPNTGAPPNSKRYFTTGDYGLFAQDQWKVLPTLTVTVGLRWEYFSPVTEKNGTLSNYILGSQGVANGTVQKVSQLYNKDLNNFGPRLGFSWSPSKYQDKILFRGGFGILFNRPFGDIFDNVRQNTPYFAQVSTCCFFDPGNIIGPPPNSNILYALGTSTQANSYPSNPNLANGVAPDGALCGDKACDFVTPVDIYGALPNEPTPYVYIFSGEIQSQLARDLVFTMGYQGSRSRKLIQTIDLNRINPGDTFDATQDKFQHDGSNGQPCGPTNPTCQFAHATGNPRFNRIFVPLPDVNASFDALVVRLNKNFSRGFQFGANYTWSHSIDTASYEIGYQQTDPSNPSINRASSDFDVRQNFVASALWDLPSPHKNAFVNTVLGGWTVSGIISLHTGFPYSALIGSCNTNADRNGDGYCPDLPFAYFGGVIASPSKQQWINGVFPNPKASFDTTTLGPGCRCRNIFTGPGYSSVDMTFGKAFKFGEFMQLYIRANVFNIFNTLNLTPLIPATASTDIVNTGSFGRTSDGLAGRVLQFQARLTF
ncbi:MAG TPA: TonB-dependent receptor [Terriglobales bacterium]